MIRRGKSSATGWLNRAGNIAIDWFNRATIQHSYIWGALKWLTLGAIGATLLYFTGALAAIPFLASVVAQQGAVATIVGAAAVLAPITASLWYGIVKPLGNFLANRFHRFFASRPPENRALLSPNSSSSQRNHQPAIRGTSPLPVPLPSLPPSLPLPLPSSLRSRVDASVTAASPSKGSTFAPERREAAREGGTKVEAKQPQDSKEVKHDPSKGKAALVLIGKEIDISYIYDTLTVYLKKDSELAPGDLDVCLAKCTEIIETPVSLFGMRLMMQESVPKTEAVRSRKFYKFTLETKDFGEAQKERFIYHAADDHDFYHQDTIDRDRLHSHVKFKRAITQDQFTQMIEVFRSEGLITPAQKEAYVAAFKKRNTDAEAAVDAICTPAAEAKSSGGDARKLKDGQALIQYIGACQNNDVLLHLHEYLLSEKFDYLRVISAADLHPKAPEKEWQGMSRFSAEPVPTSGTWAKLEKALRLQMIENWRQHARQFTPELGAERRRQFATSHPFFAIKSSRDPKAPFAPRSYKTLEAFSNADEAILSTKRRKVFGS